MDDHGFDHRSCAQRGLGNGSMLEQTYTASDKSFLECDIEEHLLGLPGHFKAQEMVVLDDMKVERQKQEEDEQQQQQQQEQQEEQQKQQQLHQDHFSGDHHELKVAAYNGEGPGEQVFAALSCSLEEFRSKRYYLFNGGAHNLMIASLLDSTNPTAAEISTADPTFQPLPWQNKRGITATSAIEDRWRDFKAKLGVKIDATGKRFLFHKRDASRYIPHTGQWLEIVKTCHVDAAARHWGRNLTKHQITKRWMYGERNHGIPETFVDAFIDSCGCCRREQLPPVTITPALQSKKRKLGKKLSTSLFGVHFIRQKIDEIAQQVVAAANFDPSASLKHVKSLEDGTSSSDFEKLNEDEQIKLKEKLTAIRNDLDSTLVHLPSMSRGSLFNSLQAIDGMITDLKSPPVDRQAFAAKLPAVQHIGTKHTSQPCKMKDDFQEPPKPTKKVKWKDLARSPGAQQKDYNGAS